MPNRIVRCGSAIARGKALRWSCSARIDAIFLYRTGCPLRITSAGWLDGVEDPVLVDGARMPTENELPDSLKPLSRRNAVMLSHHRFGPEVDDLARALQRAWGCSQNPLPLTLLPLERRRLLCGSIFYFHSRDEFQGSHFGFLAWPLRVSAC